MSEEGEKVSASANARVRRPADLLFGVLSGIAFGALLLLANGLPLGSEELTGDVAQWLGHNVPRGLAYVFGSAVGLGCFALVVVASVTMIRHALRDGANAAIAAIVGSGVMLGLVVVWRSTPGPIASAMLSGTDAVALVVTVGFVAFVTGTDLVRRPRWTKWSVLAVMLVILGELALDDLTFFATIAVPLMGWTAGLGTRWALGALSVRPSPEALASWLDGRGIAVENLESSSGRPGFVGEIEDGRRVAVSLANRDTRGSGFARRLWHSVRLRGSVTGSEAISRRSQLEHQALACFVAAGAEIVSPRVLLLDEFPPETLVLCTVVPEGNALSSSATPNETTALFGALRSLHSAGVAHRDLRPEHLIVDGEGPGFSSLERAQTSSGELVRRLDVAQLLTTATRVLGAKTAVASFREGYAPDDEAAIVAVLQPIALASWGWSAMRASTSCLSEVRREFVTDGDRAEPQRLERFRYRTVLSTVALTIAAFVLIGQLSKVDLVGALSHMNPGWFLVAVAASALTYYGAALNLAAFVPKRLSMVRGFFVQLSSAFVGVAMPPTVGHVAVNSRYLHRQGVDDGSIAAAVALSQIVNVATTLPLLVVIGVLTGSGVSRFHIVPGANLLIGVGAIVGVVGVLMLIPKTRSLVTVYVWPKVRSALPRLLEAISQPVRMAVGIGGNILLTVGYVVALLAALYALGAHPPILATAAVYLAGNAVGSIAPTPGGLGAVEVVMSAGLTAIGIPAHEAFSAVLIFRVATFWLPIPSGWISFTFLQRAGTL